MRFLLVIVAIVFSPACGWLTTGYQPAGQAELKNFETRTVDSKFDDVYGAATEALFDLGYQIRHSEKASGLIVGEQSQKYSETVYLGKGIWDRRDKQHVYEITLLIKPETKKTTNVRIKTSYDGQPSLNKDAIDKVWVYIDRQILMESPATPEKKAKTPKTRPSRQAN